MTYSMNCAINLAVREKKKKTLNVNKAPEGFIY